MDCCKKGNPWDSVDNDVVVFHQFWHGKFCPCFSPFVVKVETYLRLAGINYEKDFTKPFGPKKKCPWITLNKEDIGDSQLIIEHLNNHFNVDLDKDLTAERKAVLEAVRCMCEHLFYWLAFMWRYYHCKSVLFAKTQNFPTPYLKFFFRYLLPRQAYKKCLVHGIGAHTKEQQHNMMMKIVDTVSVLLGDRKFLGGDKPCSVDCTVFGFVSQVVWNECGSKYERIIKDDYPQLVRYAESMKEIAYPDWDSLLNP